MTAYDRYRALLRKLQLVRLRQPEGGSAEEDALLDAMDEVWAEMSDGERSAISSERARALGLPDQPGGAHSGGEGGPA